MARKVKIPRRAQDRENQVETPIVTATVIQPATKTKMDRMATIQPKVLAQGNLVDTPKLQTTPMAVMETVQVLPAANLQGAHLAANQHSLTVF